MISPILSINFSPTYNYTIRRYFQNTTPFWQKNYISNKFKFWVNNEKRSENNYTSILSHTLLKSPPPPLEERESCSYLNLILTNPHLVGIFLPICLIFDNNNYAHKSHNLHATCNKTLRKNSRLDYLQIITFVKQVQLQIGAVCRLLRGGGE